MEKTRNCRRLPRLGAFWLLVAVAAIGLVAGCGDTKSGKVKRLKPRELPFLDDVPVPHGFKLVDKMTEDYESGGQRMARHEYRGYSDPYRVREFYEEQMPLMGWSRMSKQNVQGIITMRFENKYESCTVTISPIGMFNRTAIRVIVNPFNRTPTEPPKRPKS